MLEGELCVVFAFHRLTKCSTGSRFYLFHLERDSNGEITKMREVNSNECQPGIKSFFLVVSHQQLLRPQLGRSLETSLHYDQSFRAVVAFFR